MVRECVRDAGVHIDAMIISAQGDGLWALDSDKRPFMDGIVCWMVVRRKSVRVWRVKAFSTP